MATKEINVERFSITSSKAFGEVVKVLEASVGHPNMNTFMSDIISASSFTDLRADDSRRNGSFLANAIYEIRSG